MIPIRNAVAAFALLMSTAPALAGPGIMYADGRIGDHPVRFMIDTGADEISIPYNEAIRMGLPVFDGPRLEYTTASGPVGVYRLTLPSVTVGSVTLHDVAAHVSESPLGVPAVLLGMSFLRRVNVCFLQGRMVISDPATATPPQSACQEQSPH